MKGGGSDLHTTLQKIGVIQECPYMRRSRTPCIFLGFLGRKFGLVFFEIWDYTNPILDLENRASHLQWQENHDIKEIFRQVINIWCFSKSSLHVKVCSIRTDMKLLFDQYL